MSILQFILCLVILIGIIAIFMMMVNGAYAQQFQNPGDQFNQPGFGNDQFSNNQQFQGNQQFDQNQGFNQGFNQQYQQQPYGMNQQYGTPAYGPQQPYGYPQQNMQYGGFDIQSIIAALVAGGSSAAYSRRKTNNLEKDNQQLYSEVLKGKQVDAELARITYQLNQEKANQINDAPAIKLDTLQKDVEQFTDKTAKA